MSKSICALLYHCMYIFKFETLNFFLQLVQVCNIIVCTEDHRICLLYPTPQIPRDSIMVDDDSLHNRSILCFRSIEIKSTLNANYSYSSQGHRCVGLYLGSTISDMSKSHINTGTPAPMFKLHLHEWCSRLHTVCQTSRWLSVVHGVGLFTASIIVYADKCNLFLTSANNIRHGVGVVIHHLVKWK